MRRQTVELPVVLTDSDLVKTTAEANRDAISDIGELLDIRTPLKTEVTLLKTPEITPTYGPWRDLQKLREGDSDVIEDEEEEEGEEVPQEEPEEGKLTDEQKIQKKWYGGIDYKTPLRDLIQPRTDLLRTPQQIENFVRRNLHLFERPSHYVGHEANMDDPALYDIADIRILIVRLSPYDSVNGSLTHGALAQMSRAAAKEGGFKVYTDMAFMPAMNKDAIFCREKKLPFLFGRTSKRHPNDFDVIMFSCALTMEVWNIIPTLIYSGIPPFKTMRDMKTPLNSDKNTPVILLGGVVADFLENLYGECEGESCVPDVTIIGDGEYTVPLALQLYNKIKKQGGTKADFLRQGHDLAQNSHFERDAGDQKRYNWWYEPDLYIHKLSEEPDPKTGYRELKEIVRKPGYEYAAAPGQLKRAVMRDLNQTMTWVEAPLQFDGSLGPSADIQISCVVGETWIETDMGFEQIEKAYERLKDEEEVGGVLVQTRFGLHQAEKIVATGKKKVRKYTFRDDHGKHELSIICSDDHKFDTHIEGDGEPDWMKAKDLTIGQEVWAVEPELYQKIRETHGKKNIDEQHYYSQQMTLELKEIGEYYEAETYDIQKCDVEEYIADGFITHNSGCLSGGLCSFCVAEGTEVSIRGKQVKIETLDDMTFDGEDDEREFDTPYGLQVPEGVKCVGNQPCVTLTTKRGRTLTCTKDHPILTYRKGQVLKVNAGELEAEKDIVILIQGITGEVISKNDHARDFLFPACLRPKASKNKVRTETQKKAGDLALKEPKKGEISKEQTEWYRVLRKAHAYAELIIDIKDAGIKKVYDVWNIPKGHVFYANAMVVSNCHTADTRVTLADNSQRRIDEIEPGTAIVTTQGKIRPVIKKYERSISEEIGIWQTKEMSHPVRTTLNHKFLTITQDKASSPEEKYRWDMLEEKSLGELKIGDLLVSPESTPSNLKLTPLTYFNREHYTGRVFNLEVGDETHSYRLGETKLDPQVEEILDSLQNPEDVEELQRLMEGVS